MKLRYLREECYEELKDNVKLNYSNYLKSDSWLLDYFKDIECYQDSSIEVLEPKLFNDEKSDYNNAILVFESLKNLTPFQATNVHLWTYLTHVTFYNYMNKRWKIIDGEVNENSLTRIKERYLCKNSRRGLLRNGISRLWWATYLSYDEDSTDHYTYTKLLFSEEELFTGLLEREFSMCKSVVIGTLKYFKDYYDKYNKLPSRELRRELMKYLNYQGAIVMYDVLSSDEVCEMVKNYIETNDNMI